jgi:hypothetical protein
MKISSEALHRAHMLCRSCGHCYTLTPAAVVINGRDDVSRYFGSAYDFCVKCDEGAPAEIPQDREPWLVVDGTVPGAETLSGGPEGSDPPFYVFDVDAQDYPSRKLPTRNAAEKVLSLVRRFV